MGTAPRVQPAHARYGVFCGYNSSNPGTLNPADNTFPFQGFVFAYVENGGWTPDPDVTGAGATTKLMVPDTLTGQTDFWVCAMDYANDLTAKITAVSARVTSAENLLTGGPTFSFSNPDGEGGVAWAGSTVAANGPAVVYQKYWAKFINGINQHKGNTMAFSISVTVKRGNGTIVTFSTDPEMEVDPDTNG
jgi:hypothetical protein